MRRSQQGSNGSPTPSQLELDKLALVAAEEVVRLIQRCTVFVKLSKVTSQEVSQRKDGKGATVHRVRVFAVGDTAESLPSCEVYWCSAPTINHPEGRLKYAEILTRGLDGDARTYEALVKDGFKHRRLTYEQLCAIPIHPRPITYDEVLTKGYDDTLTYQDLLERIGRNIPPEIDEAARYLSSGTLDDAMLQAEGFSPLGCHVCYYTWYSMLQVTALGLNTQPLTEIAAALGIHPLQRLRLDRFVEIEGGGSNPRHLTVWVVLLWR